MMEKKVCNTCKSLKLVAAFKIIKKGYSKNCLSCLQRKSKKKEEALKIDAAKLKKVKESLLNKGEKRMKIAPLVFLEYGSELKALSIEGFLKIEESWNEGIEWVVELI